MRYSFQLASTLLAWSKVAIAQTPEGFEPAVSEPLSVAFGDTSVSPAGVTLPREATQSLPSIATDGELQGSYVLLIVDLDVPQRNGDVIDASQPRVQLLHALIPGYTSSSDGSLTSSDAEAAPAPFIGPAPPAENPPVPHRYVELLFEQPENFAVPEIQTEVVQMRRGFNTTAFVEAAGLSAPIRGNYFQVVNNSLASAPTPTPSGEQPPAYTGSAGKAAGSTFGAIVAAGVMFLAL